MERRKTSEELTAEIGLVTADFLSGNLCFLHLSDPHATCLLE